DRIGETVCAVDEDEVELARLERRKNLMRGPDPEAHGRAVDAEPLARAADPSLLVRVGSNGLVLGSRGREDDRRRARSRLERGHPPANVLLEPAKGRPREAPVL